MGRQAEDYLQLAREAGTSGSDDGALMAISGFVDRREHTRQPIRHEAV